MALRLTNTLFEDGEIDEAVKFWTRMVSNYPNFRNPCEQLVQAFILQNNPRAELNYWRETVVANPTNPVALERLAELIRNHDILSLVIDIWKEVLSKDIFQATAMNGLVQAFESNDDLPEIIDYWTKTFCSPKNVWSLAAARQLTNAWNQMGRSGEAVKFWMPLFESDSRNYIVAEQLATSFRHSGDISGAMEYWRTKLKAHPSSRFIAVHLKDALKLL